MNIQIYLVHLISYAALYHSISEAGISQPLLSFNSVRITHFSCTYIKWEFFSQIWIIIDFILILILQDLNTSFMLYLINTVVKSDCLLQFQQNLLYCI